VTTAFYYLHKPTQARLKEGCVNNKRATPVAFLFDSISLRVRHAAGMAIPSFINEDFLIVLIRFNIYLIIFSPLCTLTENFNNINVSLSPYVNE